MYLELILMIKHFDNLIVNHLVNNFQLFRKISKIHQ